MTLSDPELARFINDRFVPCWESVRPVPQVSIDFGNGKTLRRTLAGNTVMYVCFPDGRVADLFPGIHTPKDLRFGLETALETVAAVRGRPSDRRSAAVIDWHRQQVTPSPAAGRTATTMSKGAVQGPLLYALGAREQPERTGAASAPVGDAEAAFARASAWLSDISKQPATLDRIRRRYTAANAGRKPTPDELARMAVEQDSRTNMTFVRSAVHLLFATYPSLPVPGAMRDRVFKELLHVPIDDPYLGLGEALLPGTTLSR